MERSSSSPSSSPSSSIHNKSSPITVTPPIKTSRYYIRLIVTFSILFLWLRSIFESDISFGEVSSAAVVEGIDLSFVEVSSSIVVTLPASQPLPRILPSTSSLPPSTSFSPSSKDKVSEWPWPHIHVVRTFFMQNQGKLTTLARARIELFKTFCLPTMKDQTSQQFLWLIRTDPGLDAMIMKEMVDLLKDNPNFYLLGSNNQKYDFNGLDVAKVYTGNQTLLQTAMGLQRQLPLLESRLDADDGLYLDFFRDIQKRALESLAKDNLKWISYCYTTAVAWRMYEKEPYGSLSMDKDSFCITPGLTGVRSAGVTSDFHQKNHIGLLNKIIKLVPDKSCGFNKTSRCLVVLDRSSGRRPVRSRTPTSAGMSDVVVADKRLSQDAGKRMALLQILQDDFHIPRDSLIGLNLYLQRHLSEIAQENPLGQCSKGRSCKFTTKQNLKALLGKNG